ncbi:ATP-binding protein [Nonomuraea sp. NPDC050663]|uniref:HAMP domain-containing sensor histidine kinase n=1 Tax=Nonomuraea sp. NPDC050663 TaxID=3364370 RepID=UPI0037AE3571
MKLNSVRVRATLAATLVVAVALVVVAFVLTSSLRGTLWSSANALATQKAMMAASGTLTERTQPGVTVERITGETADAAGAGDAGVGAGATADDAGVGAGAVADLTRVPTYFGTISPDGNTLSLAKPIYDPDIAYATTAVVPAQMAEPGYAVARLNVTEPAGETVTVFGRASLDTAERTLQTLNTVLLPGVPLLLFIVAGMTWFAVGRALRPVAAIRGKMADITASDLHQRVPVPPSDDEIAALAGTVNDTLDRLESAVEQHKRFVADAAHELRSPIATLRARLELTGDPDLAKEALADVTRLQTLASDLLLLARLDAGEPLRAKELDLSQAAAETAAASGRRPGVEIKLDIEPDVVMRGSRGHLDRLVSNLVDNAVRHADSMVVVRVHEQAGQAVLEVLDDGPGIPEESREAVFDRFTRLDEARARDAGGAGLGLPIARDIAALHGGTLVAQDGGFVARFPLNHTRGAVREDG